MTWAQFLEWREAMKGHIARRLEERRFAGGNGVIVQGNMVTVEPAQSAKVEAYSPEWELIILARIKVTTTDRDGDWSPWEVASGVFRKSGLLWSNYFWEKTQIVATLPDEGPGFTRKFELELQVRGVTGYRLATSDQNDLPYYIPVRMELGEFDSRNGVMSVEPSNTYTMDIRRSGASRTFTPSEAEQFTELRPIAITRL